MKEQQTIAFFMVAVYPVALTAVLKSIFCLIALHPRAFCPAVELYTGQFSLVEAR